MTVKRFVLIYSALILSSLGLCLLGYRYFIEIPTIKKNIEISKQKELNVISIGLKNEQNFLETLNHDYAAWDSSYKFLQNPEKGSLFLNENFIDDTFTSLKIDGVYFIDKSGNQIWGKAFCSINQNILDFSGFIGNFKSTDSLYPVDIKNNMPTKTGIANTQYGAAMFSVKQVRNSDISGNNIGALVFVKLIRKNFFESLEELAQVKISINPHNKENQKIDIDPAHKIIGENVVASVKIISDYKNNPLLFLNINHEKFNTPNLINLSLVITALFLMLIPLIVLLILNKFLMNPILLVVEKIGKMSKGGNLEKLTFNPKTKEFRAVVNGFNTLVETVINQKQELKNIAMIDDLTGIANIRAYNCMIERSWGQMQRTKAPLAIIMCDIDHFKKYNDSMGHQAGDHAIHDIAQALQGSLRRGDDFVARYGGEEFIAILTNTDAKKLQTAMSLMKKSVDELKIPHPESITSDYLTVSIGGAIFDNFNESNIERKSDYLVKLADKALYNSKNEGRNRISMQG